MATIRFLRANRFGRQVGTLDSDMTEGVQITLVQNGFAEFVNQPEPAAAEGSKEDPDTHRYRKRRYSKETV